MEFGSAFHLFTKLQSQNPSNFRTNIQAAMKYYRETPHIPDPKKRYLTEGYLSVVCNEWFMYHEQDAFNILKDNDGTPLVEMRFRIPFYEDDYCEIFLTGTIDKVCIHRTSKILCVGDYKTTASWDTEGYLKQYDLSGQLAIYTIALHHHINMATQESVLYPFKHLNTGAFIEGIFLRSDNKCEVKRSDVKQASEMNLDEAKELLQIYCRQITLLVQLDSLPMREGMFNGACNLVFGPCKFFNACSASSERAFQGVLDRNFVQVQYNPLLFGASQ